MAEKIYVKGVRLFPKKDNQPEWVLASGVITLAELQQFFKDQAEYVTQYEGKDQIRVQLLKGDKGAYLSLDTYKPTGQSSPHAAPHSQARSTPPDTDGLPF